VYTVTFDQTFDKQDSKMLLLIESILFCILCKHTFRGGLAPSSDTVGLYTEDHLAGKARWKNCLIKTQCTYFYIHANIFAVTIDQFILSNVFRPQSYNFEKKAEQTFCFQFPFGQIYENPKI
jgi:hypothetical protein